jgi:hypothetical protein
LTQFRLNLIFFKWKILPINYLIPEDVKLSAKQDMRSLHILIIEDKADIAENIGD